MSYPAILSYHPNISADRIIKGSKQVITGDLNDFHTDEEVLKSLHKALPNLKPPEILNRLKHKLMLPEGEVWLAE